MERIQKTCNSCGGVGHITYYKVTSEDPDSDRGIAQEVVEECSVCGGKGWKEYALFTIEEAEALIRLVLKD